MRWVGGPKISILVHGQVKNIYAYVNGWKGKNHVHVVVECPTTITGIIVLKDNYYSETGSAFCC